MKVLVYRGSSKYDLLGRFADHFADGFALLGHQVQTFSLLEPDLGGRLAKVFLDPATRPDCVFSIDSMAVNLGLEGENIYRKLGIPYLSVFVDSPIYLFERLEVPLGPCHVTCIDQTHVDLVRMLYPQVPSSFLAHGASLPGGPVPAQRDMDILFVGSYESPTATREGWGRAAAGTRALLEEIVETNFAHPELAFHDICFQVGARHGLSFATLRAPGMLAALATAETYVRAVWRQQVLEALDRAGFVVDVFGVNWDKFPPSRHRFHGPVDIDEAERTMRRARLVLSIGSNFPAGTHERTLTALACGAVPVTEANAYHAQTFDVPREMVTFQQRDLPALVAEVRGLLADEPRRRAMAEAGGRRVLAGHMWHHRAAEVIRRIDAAPGADSDAKK